MSYHKGIRMNKPFGPYTLKKLQCGCEKSFIAWGLENGMGGEHWTGVKESWTSCRKHQRLDRLDALKRKLEKSRQKKEEIERVLKEYPKMIEKLEKKVTKESPVDPTLVLERTEWDYLY